MPGLYMEWSGAFAVPVSQTSFTNPAFFPPHKHILRDLTNTLLPHTPPTQVCIPEAQPESLAYKWRSTLESVQPFYSVFYADQTVIFSTEFKM